MGFVEQSQNSGFLRAITSFFNVCKTSSWPKETRLRARVGPQGQHTAASPPSLPSQASPSTAVNAQETVGYPESRSPPPGRPSCSRPLPHRGGWDVDSIRGAHLHLHVWRLEAALVDIVEGEGLGGVGAVLVHLDDEPAVLVLYPMDSEVLDNSATFNTAVQVPAPQNTLFPWFPPASPATLSSFFRLILSYH